LWVDTNSWNLLDFHLFRHIHDDSEICTKTCCIKIATFSLSQFFFLFHKTAKFFNIVTFELEASFSEQMKVKKSSNYEEIIRMYLFSDK
jgi:hypothetical protein